MNMKILIEIFVSFKKYSRTRGHEVTLVKDCVGWISILVLTEDNK